MLYESSECKVIHVYHERIKINDYVPLQKEELMSVLNEASALSNLLLLSVSDQFELCLAKCRTSSRYV